MKIVHLLLILIVLPLSLSAQQKMIVYFDDAKSQEFIEFSERAEKRRAKNDVHLNQFDLGINDKYLQQLAQFGHIINQSRWLNAVTFETSETVSMLTQNCPFIKSITVIESLPHKPRKEKFTMPESKALNYGVADTQVRQIGADCLHDLGYKGTGVYLAVIDAGFRGMDTIPFFDLLYAEGRLLDTKDFINNFNIYDYSGHGTAVASCIFGEQIGAVPYAGTAIDVDVALYVSEDVFSETLIEEFNLVAALERCDSVGVDIATISLGYVDFDDTLQNHDYADMDGQTTIAAQGVNIAVSKGIVVTAAAGNSGPSFISTPCDADDGLCVGAVSNQGVYAPFSSVGPASDGQVKPDIAATGWNTWVVVDDGSLVMGSGTSFATPIMAGGIACLIQANPTRTSYDIIEAVQQSASQFATPDEFLGYGIPQLCVANDSLIASSIGLSEFSENDFIIYPVPATNEISIEADKINSIELYDALGRQLKSIQVTGNQTTYSLSIQDVANGVYTVILNSNKSKSLVVLH